jgi:hypothetical protein
MTSPILLTCRRLHNSKVDLAIPKVGTSIDETVNPVNEHAIQSAQMQPHVDTSAIDHEINKVSQQIDQIKSQPKGPTKTQIDDQLRSLEINDGHLTASRRR